MGTPVAVVLLKNNKTRPSKQTHAPDPRSFGRRAIAVAAAAPVQPALSDDFKLFAMTFAAGFLFVSILIG